MVVDVSDLDLHQLVRELWNNTVSTIFFYHSNLPAPTSPSDEDIDKVVRMGKIDYLNERPIKIDIRDPTKVNTYHYNRDAGDGKFEQIVAKLRGD